MSDTQLQLVTFEQAKKLKQLGFGWYCSAVYYEKFPTEIFKGQPNTNHNSIVNQLYKSKEQYSAPTVALALKWLRDEKEVVVCVECKNKGWYVVNVKTHFLNSDITLECQQFEQAESAGLDYALDYLLKHKDDWMEGQIIN